MTPTNGDREAREALRNYSIRYNGPGGPSFTMKHARTILALLDAPRLPRPENLTNDVLDAMHAAYSVSLNAHEQFTFVRNAMRAAYRALYDHCTAPPQPKKELWLVMKGDEIISCYRTKAEADKRKLGGDCRMVHFVEDR